MTTCETSNDLIARPNSRWTPARTDGAPPLVPADLPQDMERRDKKLDFNAEITHQSSGLTDVVKHSVINVSGQKAPLLAIALATAFTIWGILYFLIASERVTPPSEPASTTLLPEDSVGSISKEKPIATVQEDSGRSPTASGGGAGETSILTPPAQTFLRWPEPTAARTGSPPAPSGGADNTQQAAPVPSPGTDIALESPPPAVQASEVLFLQKSGVNIRSAPSATGRVIGSAPKGASFEITNREGEWLQVKGTGVSGWINARFLGTRAPR